MIRNTLRNVLSRAGDALSGRRTHEPAPAAAPSRTTLDLVAETLRSDERSPGVLDADAFRGHAWYPLDTAFSALRRRLRADPGWRYGPAQVCDRVQWTFDLLRDHAEVRGKAYCELGCGRHHPFGAAAVLFVNGAASALALDIENIENPARSAEALQDLLVEMLAFPDGWNWTGVTPAELSERVRAFDLEALRNGDLEAGLAGVPLRHALGDITAAGTVEESSIDILTSYTVLEHFMDFDATCAALSRMMRPGAVALHNVDLTDHRFLVAPDRFNEWSFLTEPDAWSDGLTNRLRASELRAGIEAAGFEILHEKRIHRELPADLRPRLAGRFAAMPDDELSCVNVHYVTRKP